MKYRAYLFHDLLAYVGTEFHPKRILEIGPKDGQDSYRLLRLTPLSLTLLDLPTREASNVVWRDPLTKYARYCAIRVDYISADITTHALPANTYDLIWCTGVLYHVKEQLPLIRSLYDALTPGGVLILESATIRNPFLRWFNCVQLLWPFNERVKQWYHLSKNVTHLPSQKAIVSWLEMAGFGSITQSTCHAKVSWKLARTRTAYLARKPW